MDSRGYYGFNGYSGARQFSQILSRFFLVSRFTTMSNCSAPGISVTRVGQSLGSSKLFSAGTLAFCHRNEKHFVYSVFCKIQIYRNIQSVHPFYDERPCLNFVILAKYAKDVSSHVVDPRSSSLLVLHDSPNVYVGACSGYSTPGLGQLFSLLRLLHRCKANLSNLISMYGIIL